MIKRLELKSTASDLDTRIIPLQIKAVGDKGEIEGYGSVFGQVDSVNDIVAKGAFGRSLAQHISDGTNVKFLYQHDPEKPIGIWDEVIEDERGLKVHGRFLTDTTLGREAHILAKSGAVDGLSIGYRTKRYEYQPETEIRILTEVDLWEVSLVTFPALRTARVQAVKSELTERRVEEVLRDVGFSIKQAKAMVAAWKSVAVPRDADPDVDLVDLKSSALKLAELFR